MPPGQALQDLFSAAIRDRERSSHKRATALSRVKLVRVLIRFGYWNKRQMKQNLRNISDTLVQTEFLNMHF